MATVVKDAGGPQISTRKRMLKLLGFKPGVSQSRDWKGTTRGVAKIALNIAGGAAEAFSPLKAVLSVISTVYETYEVRLRPPLKLLSNISICRKRLA